MPSSLAACTRSPPRSRAGLSLGLLKGRVVGSALVKSGAQVLLIGGTSAAIGWLVGSYVPRLF